MNRINQLQVTLSRIDRERFEILREIDTLQKACSHDWEIRYTPEITKAHTVPGDVPGTMGVDYRGPVYVPEKTVDKWTRNCSKCGKEETTKELRSVLTHGPIPGTTCTKTEPHFR